jgi:membrane-associated PAP2 superfamily phosphatase
MVYSRIAENDVLIISVRYKVRKYNGPGKKDIAAYIYFCLFFLAATCKPRENQIGCFINKNILIPLNQSINNYIHFASNIIPAIKHFLMSISPCSEFVRITVNQCVVLC